MSVPLWLLEGSNGATAFALAFVVAFQVMFLTAAAIKIQSAISFYRQMKPVIALTVGFAGLLIRFGAVWIRQYKVLHGLPPLDPTLAIFVHVAGTCMSIVGVLCWLRVTMPQFCGTRTWLAIAVLAGVVFLLPLFG